MEKEDDLGISRGGSEGMSEPKGEGTSNLPLFWVSVVSVRVDNRS
jgi:hypothetical protein